MRHKMPFPPYYSCRYDDSPVADSLRDFDAWLRAAEYCTTKRRTHLSIVRLILERADDLPEDRRFDARDLARLFRSRIRPRSFSASRWAFEQHLRSRGRWIETQAIGHALIDRGWRVFFSRTDELVQKLQAARRDLRLPSELAKLDRFDLLMLDDVSYVRKDQAETSVLFELIAERYERKSLAITANQPFSAWEQVFPDRP
jgi:hypothetical protein